MAFAVSCTALRFKVINPFKAFMTNASENMQQSPYQVPSFELRGNRFKPLTWETMSLYQQMTPAVLAGKHGNMQGPYNVLLRSPEVGHLAQSFGAHTRFNSSLPLPLNESDILLVARDWTAQLYRKQHHNSRRFDCRYFGQQKARLLCDPRRNRNRCVGRVCFFECQFRNLGRGCCRAQASDGKQGHRHSQQLLSTCGMISRQLAWN